VPSDFARRARTAGPDFHTRTEGVTYDKPTVTVTAVSVPVGTAACQDFDRCIDCTSGYSSLSLKIRDSAGTVLVTLVSTAKVNNPCKFTFATSAQGYCGEITFDVATRRWQLMLFHAGTDVLGAEAYKSCDWNGILTGYWLIEDGTILASGGSVQSL
jgi:hypothetical protein